MNRHWFIRLKCLLCLYKTPVKLQARVPTVAHQVILCGLRVSELDYYYTEKCTIFVI